MQPVSRKMQRNEQTDRVQGHSSCKTVFASTPTLQGCLLRVAQPWDVSMSAWALGSEAASRGWRVSPALLGAAVNGVSTQGFPIAQMYLPCSLFQLTLSQTIALMAASSPWIITPQHLQMPRMGSTPSSTTVLLWFLSLCIPQLGKKGSPLS